MEKILFNPEKIREVRLVYGFTKLQDSYKLIYRRGDIIKHWLGWKKLAKENIYDFGFIRSKKGNLGSLKEYVGSLFGDEYFDSVYEIGPDSKIYYKPHIKIFFTDGTEKTRFFDTVKELEDYYNENLEPYLENFIRVFNKI